jgi:hypothetical protein
MPARRVQKVFETISRFFSTTTRGTDRSSRPSQYESKLGLECLESRDCPTTITINHPGAWSSYAPVSGSLFGANGPSYLDVRQGAVGDCWLLASLAEVAARAPADIANMFTYEGTAIENGATVGLYNVRFFNSAGTAEYFLVDTELPAGGNLYDHPDNGVLWVALAEKAYVQANAAGVVPSGNEGSDSYTALNGGYASWALHAITGQWSGIYGFNSNDIAGAWNAGGFIVMGSDSSPQSSGIVADHAYAVVGYNPASSMPFTVFNPWGASSSGWISGNGETVYGLFAASAGFLSANFNSESFGAAAVGGAVAQLPGGSGTVQTVATSAPAATPSAPPPQTAPSESALLTPQITNRTTQTDPAPATVPVTEQVANESVDISVN